MVTITLKPKKSNPFRLGHPWVFSGAVADVAGSPIAGDWVRVVDEHTTLLGYGFFNPHSLYRVRLISTCLSDMAQCITHHLKRALERRQACGLPNTTTDAYRLCNSEGDQLSVLTIDVYGNSCVIAPSAYWVMRHQTLIEQAVRNLLPQHTLYWKPIPKPLSQDGWNEALSLTQEAIALDVTEHALTYRIVPTHQKTGFFCDQRENRYRIRQFAAGRRVLDICCYTGGFALNAARAGAKHVIGIDSSSTAIATAQDNAERNQLTIDFQERDAFDALKACEPVDVICLDPPKIAPSRHHITKALRYYTELHQLALEKLTDNGILLTCSCSASITALDLVRSLQEAAHRTQRTLSVLMHTRAGPDHPVAPALFDTTDYLQAVWVHVA